MADEGHRGVIVNDLDKVGRGVSNQFPASVWHWLAVTESGGDLFCSASRERPIPNFAFARGLRLP